MARQGTIKVKERIELLDKINGWVWDIEEDKFQKMYTELKKFALKYKGFPRKEVTVFNVYIGEYKLNMGSWIFSIRSVYKKIQNGELKETGVKRILRSKKDPRIKLIEEIPYWQWATKVDMITYNEAKAIVNKLKLKNRLEYVRWWRETGKNLEVKIPAKPDNSYYNNGWISWEDWLGATK